MSSQGFDVIKELRPDIDMAELVDVLHSQLQSSNHVLKARDGLRKVCMVCGYLRARIKNHDEKFFLREGRLPVENERATIDQMAVKHREMKRYARNFAAARIQSLARGKRARRVVWGAAGKGTPTEVLENIRSEMAAPKAIEEMRFERKGNIDTLQALVERMNAERKLAGREYPSMDSSAEELHAEKALIKTVLKSHTKALSDNLKRTPTAMDLEAAKPVFVLYHIINSRIKELNSVGADTETARSKEVILKERIHDLRQEAKRLKVILGKYEEAFVAKHGRKMKTQNEIEPIKKEYARFKDVKRELQSLGGSSTDRSSMSDV